MNKFDKWIKRNNDKSWMPAFMIYLILAGSFGIAFVLITIYNFLK